MTRYSPFTWADDESGGTPITAARLNALEAGVDADVPVADIDATGTPSSTTYLRGDGTWATPAGGSGALDDLTDVDAPTPADGDVLTYDTGTSEWVAAAPTGGAPDASETVKGIVELATTAETTTGVDTVRATTPAGVKAVADTLAPLSHSHAASDITSGTVATARLGSGSASSSTYLRGDQTYAALPTSSATVSGIVELATDAEAVTGTDTARAVTPANVAAVVAVTRARYSGINAQTGTTYAPVLSDEGKLVTLSNASAITVTMPQDSTTAFPVGATIDFVGVGAGLVTFSAGTGATVNPTAVTRAQWSAATAIKSAADTWLIVGDLA